MEAEVEDMEVGVICGIMHQRVLRRLLIMRRQERDIGLQRVGSKDNMHRMVLLLVRRAWKAFRLPFSFFKE